MKLTSLPIAKIRRDGGTQARVGTTREVAGSYALSIEAGARLPAPVVFHDAKGRYWLADGFHTLTAYEITGARRIDTEVREGTLRDAVLFATGANANHGLQRSNADKRKAVRLLLEDQEWGQWPNRKIADHCAVDEGLVRKVKKEMRQGDNADNPQPLETEEGEDWTDEEKAKWASMSEGEKAQVRELAHADAVDERLEVIEKSVAKIRRKLGYGREMWECHRELDNLVEGLYARLKRKPEAKTALDDEARKEVLDETAFVKRQLDGVEEWKGMGKPVDKFAARFAAAV